MTTAPNKTKAAAELRCRNPRETHAPGESPRMVACQSREVAGVWDILDDESWINPTDRDPRRIPLCRTCAEELGHFEEPVATAIDLPRLIEAGTCWCHLRPGLRVCWCPAHGLIEEE